VKRPVLGAAVANPLAIASLAVLAVNDHVLKARFPGLVTGKLSDFAGMALAPLVLVALADAVVPARLLARQAWPRASAWACACAVAIAFALAKTWAPATHAYEAAFAWLWRGRVTLVRDASDLVALPMGALAAIVATRRAQGVTSVPRISNVWSPGDGAPHENVARPSARVTSCAGLPSQRIE